MEDQLEGRIDGTVSSEGESGDFQNELLVD